MNDATPDSASAWLERCREWADETACELILCQPPDGSALGTLANRIEQQVATLGAVDAPLAGALAARLGEAGRQLRTIVAEPSVDSRGVLNNLRRILDEMQAVTRGGPLSPDAAPPVDPTVCPPDQPIAAADQAGGAGPEAAEAIPGVSASVADGESMGQDPVPGGVETVATGDSGTKALPGALSPTPPPGHTGEGGASVSAEPPPGGGTMPGVEPMVPVGDREIATEFVVEAHGHFDAADESLLHLEKDPGDMAAMGVVFRAFHTVKGVAGFLGYQQIEKLAHVTETLLDEVRDGRRVFAGAVVDATFNSLDMLKTMIGDLHNALYAGADGVPVRDECNALVETLESFLVEAPSVSSPHDEGRDSAPVAPAAVTVAATDDPVDEAAPGAQRTAQADRIMRVDAARVDALLDMIGELVITESIVSGDPEIRALKSVRIEKSLALLDKLTRSLQDMGMSMRMVPVEPVFRKMARLARDLSRKAGKDVELIFSGGETGIDRSMVEGLGDPLVHMVRNAIDHGLEPAAERVALGKPATGRIRLNACHKGGNIHVEIRDDGRGLDRGAIVAKAIQRGLIQRDQGMADSDVFALIFEPGFSTAARVTDLSGRGVGMDVVRRNVEAMRGHVVIDATPGKGSVFTLVLPLTTAIIDGMLTAVGGEVYIVPTLVIIESFRPTPAQVQTVYGRGEVVRFRDGLLPLFRLSRILGTRDASDNPQQAMIVVVEDAGKRWALMVDKLIGQQHVVIKSLGEGMGPTPGIAGACILSDGRPGLIVDIGGLVRLAMG